MRATTDDPGAGASWWGAVGLALGGAATAAFQFLGGKRSHYKDQLQLALERLEKMERRVDGQSGEIDRLRRQLTDSEAARARLVDQVSDLTAQLQELQDANAEHQAARDELQAEVATALEHVAALSQQVTQLGAQPAPRPERPRDNAGRFAKTKGRRK